MKYLILIVGLLVSTYSLSKTTVIDLGDGHVEIKIIGDSQEHTIDATDVRSEDIEEVVEEVYKEMEKDLENTNEVIDIPLDIEMEIQDIEDEMKRIEEDMLLDNVG